MFITFEGIEGAGKGTLIGKLAAWLKSLNKEFIHTREPGGSQLGVFLRQHLLNTQSNLCPKAELFLYLADRAEHIHTVIKPALAEGKIVLSDRFSDSTVAYQGHARGFSPTLLTELNSLASESLIPDITFLIDLDVEIGLKRARARNIAEGKELSEGRFENESIHFHTTVRQAYLELAQKNPERFCVLAGEKTPDEIYKQAQEVLIKKFAI